MCTKIHATYPRHRAGPVTDRSFRLMFSVHCRSIQHQHLGQLALPSCEFLAVTHGTSYAGYSAERNVAVERPFFVTGTSDSVTSGNHAVHVFLPVRPCKRNVVRAAPKRRA